MLIIFGDLGGHMVNRYASLLWRFGRDTWEANLLLIFGDLAGRGPGNPVWLYLVIWWGNTGNRYG